MADRYWVSASAGNWTDTANWSTTSGGSGGASVPGASDDVFFDSNGVGDCTTVNSVTCLSLNMAAGYTGVLYLTNSTGAFNRGITTPNATIGSGCRLGGATSRTSVLTITNGTFIFNGDPPAQSHVDIIVTGDASIVLNTLWDGNVGCQRSCTLQGKIGRNASLIPSFANYTVTIGGDLEVYGSFSIGNSAAANSLNNSGNNNLAFRGDVDFTNVTYTAGTGTITLDNTAAQSINFNGQTVEPVVVSDASTGAITLGADFTTPYVHDCSGLIDLNGFTITETGTDPNPCGAFRLLIDGFNDLLINGGLVD